MDAVADRSGQGLRRGPVRAAGGLVAHDGRVLLVHRPRFDDWSLPKGKLQPGEHPLVAAVREVHEETMVHGVPGVRLPSVTYQVRSGQSHVDKIVDWWAMTVADAGPFVPSDEVDDVAWLSVPRALEVVTYERDRTVLEAYAELPAVARPVVVVRHASADDHPAWSGPPDERPLDARGRAQAAGLAELLRVLRPGRLVSAPALCCRQTLTELARTLDLDLEIEEDITEGADPVIVVAALRRLVNDRSASVVCGGDALAAALATLTGGAVPTPDRRLAPADGVVLSFSGATLVAADPVTLGGP
ncbi:MAG: NUDIX hydrolase [Micromonosporaceae bacterium]|nr:NUDIX hydrolase [Micromonosporaceae bacterium]